MSSTVMTPLAPGAIDRLNREVSEAYVRYLTQVSEKALEYVKECEQAYANYLGGLRPYNTQIGERFTAIHTKYLESLTSAWTASAAQERVKQDYAAYVKAVNSLLYPATDEQYARQARAYNELLLGLQAASATGNVAAAGDPVQRYLNTLKDIWDRGTALREASESAKACVDDFREIQTTSQAEILKAYDAYVKGLNSVWQEARLGDSLEALLKVYADRLQHAWEALRNFHEDSAKRAATEIQQAIDRYKSTL
jgi:hypothetical protein